MLGCRKEQTGGSLLSCDLQASGKSDKEISIYRCNEYYKKETVGDTLGVCGWGNFISSRVGFPKFDLLNSTSRIFIMSAYHLYYNVLLIFFL